MQSFIDYGVLNEAKSIARFLKKNKNLTPAQVKELDKYFTQVNRQASNDFIRRYGNWDSKKVRNLTYDDFKSFQAEYKSGLKNAKKMKCKSIEKKIPGTAGDDYVHVVIPDKRFCAFIPLNHETAQFMNTRKFGVCSGDWCIGSTLTAYHWNDEVLEQQQVPIYVLNNESKWVVMIHDGNRTYDVWNIDNDPNKVKEGIPGFSIRKNLLSSKQKKMYDELRSYYFEEADTTVDIEDAERDYNKLITDIETAHDEWNKNVEEFYETNERIRVDTIEKYRKEEERLENEQVKINDDISANEEKIEEYEDELAELEDNDPNNKIGIENYKLLIKALTRSNERKREEYDKIDDKLIELSNAIDDMKSMSADEVGENWDEYDWTEDPIEYENVNMYTEIPKIEWYSDYTNLISEHGWEGDYDKANENIVYYILEEAFDSAEEVLAKAGWHHPNIVNEQ